MRGAAYAFWAIAALFAVVVLHLLSSEVSSASSATGTGSTLVGGGALPYAAFPPSGIPVGSIAAATATPSSTSITIGSSTTQSLTPRVFWTSDLHDGTRCDISTTLAQGLGQEVILAGLKLDRAVYPTCMGSNVHLPLQPLAPLIARLMDSGYYINEEETHQLFEYYKNDTDMQRTDAFVCMFPLSYCEAFLPFNKTVVYLAAHRYPLGRCSSRARWDRLSQHLIEAASKGHIVAAMGRYDAEYINVCRGWKKQYLWT